MNNAHGWGESISENQSKSTVPIHFSSDPKPQVTPKQSTEWHVWSQIAILITTTSLSHYYALSLANNHGEATSKAYTAYTHCINK